MLSVADTALLPTVMAMRMLPSLPRAALAAIELVDHHTVASLPLPPVLDAMLRSCISPNALLPSHPSSLSSPPPAPVLTRRVTASGPAGVLWHKPS